MPTLQNKYALGPGFIAQYFDPDADLCQGLAEGLSDIVSDKESIWKHLSPVLLETLRKVASREDSSATKRRTVENLVAQLKKSNRTGLQREVLSLFREKDYLRHYLRNPPSRSSDRIDYPRSEGPKAKKEGACSSVEEVVKTVESVLAQLSNKTPQAATRIIIKELRLLPRERTDKDGTLQSDWSRAHGNSKGSKVELQVEVEPFRAPKGFEAGVAFHSGLDILWQNKEAARIDVDVKDMMAISGSHKVRSTLHGRLSVNDAQYFDQLVRELVTSPSLPIRTTCSTFSLVVAGIPVKATDPFATSVLIHGFDSFSDLRMELFDLPRASDAGGEAKGMEIIGEATFRSKSIVRVDIDSIKIALGYRDPNRKRSVGTVTLRSISIRSGSTLRLRLNGRFNADDPTHSQEALADLITDVLGGAQVKITLSIQSVKLLGGKSLDWQQADVRIPVGLPCTKRADLLQEVQLKSIRLRFGKDGRPTLICNDMRVKIRLPYAFEVTSVKITGALGLKWRDRTSDTFRTLGAFRYQKANLRSTSVTPINDKPGCKTSRVTFKAVQLLKAIDADGLQSFITMAVRTDSTELQIDPGDAKLVLGTAAGNLILEPGLAVKPMAVEGFHNSGYIRAELTDLQLSDGDEGSLKLTMEACFNLPGHITISAEEVSEPVSMSVACRHNSGAGDVFVGRASLSPSFTITPGGTGIRLSFDYLPNIEHTEQAGHLLSHLLSGRTSTLRIRSDGQSTRSPGLLKILRGIEMDGILEPLPHRFWKQSGSAGGTNNIATMTLTADFSTSPINRNLPLKFTKFAGTLTSGGRPWGKLSQLPPEGPNQPKYRVDLLEPLNKLAKPNWGRIKANFTLSLDIKAHLLIGRYAIAGFRMRQEQLDLSIVV